MVQGATANAVVVSSWQACPFMVFSSPPSGFIYSPTGLTPDLLHPLWPEVLLVCGTIFIFTWLIFVLYLSLLCHPTHPYLLLPHFNFRVPHSILRNSESAYSFYFYLPLCLLLGDGLCARPTLNMYVYKHLVSAVGIPQTWYQLGFLYHLSPLQQP